MDQDKLKQLTQALEQAQRDRQLELSAVTRPIASPELAGGMVGLRAGVMNPTPSGMFGIGATVGGEVARNLQTGDLQSGLVRGLDVQFRDDRQSIGVGAHNGPRGTRWGLLYGRKF